MPACYHAKPGEAPPRLAESRVSAATPLLLLFSGWYRRDAMTAEGFHRSMLTHRNRFLDLVRDPPSTQEATNLAARFAIVEYIDEKSSETGQNDLSQDYLRFMFAEGVEPTNNHAEQQIHHCVIDRRIT